MKRFFSIIQDILVAHLELLSVQLQSFNKQNEWYEQGFQDGKAHAKYSQEKRS